MRWEKTELTPRSCPTLAHVQWHELSQHLTQTRAHAFFKVKTGTAMTLLSMLLNLKLILTAHRHADLRPKSSYWIMGLTGYKHQGVYRRSSMLHGCAVRP